MNNREYSTQKEQATSSEVQMLETIFKSSVDGILIFNNQGEILKANPAIEKMFGYGIGEVLQLDIGSLIPGCLPNLPWHYSNQLKSIPQPKEMDQDSGRIGLHKNGSQFPLEIHLHTASINHENMIIAFIKPVAEPHEINQLKTEKTLQDGSRKFAALINNLPGVVYRCKNDKERTILYISVSIEQLTGYRPKFFYQPRNNFSFHRLIHPDDRQHVLAKMQAALQQRKFYEITYRITTKKKKEKWIWEHGTGIYAEDGNLLYLEGFLLDMTEKRRTGKAWQDGEIELRNYTEALEQKVKERTRELTATVKKLVETNLNLEYQIHETHMADAQAKKNHALYVAIARYFPKVMIVVINKNYQIVFLDGEELQKTGLDKEIVEGLPVKDVKNFSSEWKSRMITYAQKTFQGGHFSYEIKYKTNNYKVNTMPLDDGQLGVNLVLFVFTNITEQKRTELRMLKALKKERELSELKSRFVSMASHEFRTPLSTILSSANLIARQNEPGKEEKRLKNVERIKSSVKNLVDILNEFLSIGRLEAGEVSVKKEVFDLIDFMKTIIQELQHVQKAGQQVQLTCNEKVISVYLDKQFTRNVFLNLLSNALKYSPANQPVDIDIKAENSTLTVKIQDQGIGIPEDEQKNLFNLFFRARNVTNIEGTGLGLPIVKKYIELMHGKITFESKLQQGTTFTIVLPFEQYHNEKNFIDRR